MGLDDHSQVDSYHTVFVLPTREGVSLAGLTTTGYIARTAGEWLNVAKDVYNDICAELGVSPPRYDKAEFTTAVLIVAAQIASEIDAAAGSLFDLHDPNQASGNTLRTLAALAGVRVGAGSKSRVTLTVGAWSQGAVTLTAQEAKASDGTNTWVLIEDVIIASGGTATAVFEAEAVGPILANVGTITKRVTGVPGWVSVTNASAATPGAAADTDSQIRDNIARGNGSFGSGSELATQAALQGLDGVEKVRIVYNTTFSPITVSSRTIPENGVGVWVYPNSLTQTEQQAVLTTLFARLGGNLNRSLPTATGTDGVVGAITGADNREHSEGFWYMQPTTVYVWVQIDPATGYENGGSLGSVQEEVRSVVKTYFSLLQPGQAVRRDDLIGQIALVDGVARTTLSFSLSIESGYSTDDVIIGEANFAQLDPDTISGNFGVAVLEAPAPA